MKTEVPATGPLPRARQQTAPKNIRGPVDMQKVPTDPPFKAYIGNLSYQATTEDIKDFFCQSVVSVHLIEKDGNPQGYGFVEFETRKALIDALDMNDEMFLNRKLRIYVFEGEAARGVGPKGAGQMSNSRSRKKKAQEPEKDISQKYVCIHNLVGKCSYGVRCFNYHCKMPYQWMYKAMGSEDWHEVQPAENILMEKMYCNPFEDDYLLSVSGRLVDLDFSTMTTIGDHVLVFHRLSTNTSVVMDTQPLATKWSWYWQIQKGFWSKYGDDDCGNKSSLNSHEIEQAFVNNPEGQLEFTTAGHNYVLYFREMVQCNLYSETNRAIRRRPEFVDEKEFEMRKKKGKSQPKPGVGQRGAAVDIPRPPAVWRLRASDDLINHYQIVQLDKKNRAMQQEYQEIEDVFCRHFPRPVTIKSIERVENGDLWHSYESKKIKMRKKNNNQEVKEERLFHGTKSDIVEAIFTQGFDFRLSGTASGTRYGKGSYFAKSSAYSDCYADKHDQNNKMMFVAKVLIGEYTPGDTSYTRPPPKDPSNRTSQLYDSCVDDINMPKIFVIFQLDQVYPEYLIKYEYN